MGEEQPIHRAIERKLGGRADEYEQDETGVTMTSVPLMKFAFVSFGSKKLRNQSAM